MAQDETPELINLDGHAVYRVHITELEKFLVPGGACNYCPLHCKPKSSISQCGFGYYFVREDAWHKMKLQS